MLRLLWLVPALTGASAARSESPVGLDLDAIESRLRVETVAVERASFASVAAVNLYVLIGVSRSQMPQAGPGDVVIYLCDNDQMGLSFTGPWLEETTTYESEGVTVTLTPAALWERPGYRSWVRRCRAVVRQPPAG